MLRIVQDYKDWKDYSKMIDINDDLTDEEITELSFTITHPHLPRSHVHFSATTLAISIKYSSREIFFGCRCP